MQEFQRLFKEHPMKRVGILAGLLVLGSVMACSLAAQEKPRPAREPERVVPLKVQVVLSEFDGEKKVSSLPYTFFVNADNSGDRASMRMGLRVPIFVQANQIQYMDVGSNIDCAASSTEDGRFKLNMAIERSSMYASNADKKPLDWSPGDAPLTASTQPILRQFRISSAVVVHENQATQATLATDPLSGRVLKIDITVNQVK
jgi:hypothetical protein